MISVPVEQKRENRLIESVMEIPTVIEILTLENYLL